MISNCVIKCNTFKHLHENKTKKHLNPYSTIIVNNNKKQQLKKHFKNLPINNGRGRFQSLEII